MLHKVKDDRFFMPRLYLLSCIYWVANCYWQFSILTETQLIYAGKFNQISDAEGIHEVYLTDD